MACAYSSMGLKSSMDGEIKGTILDAGTFSDIELHYYEYEGGAACRLQWSYPGQALEAIPQSHLFP
jgi:hypothetical protein